MEIVYSILLAVLIIVLFACGTLLFVGAWAHKQDLKLHMDGKGQVCVTHKSVYQEPSK